MSHVGTSLRVVFIASLLAACGGGGGSSTSGTTGSAASIADAIPSSRMLSVELANAPATAAVAATSPALFLEIYAFARDRYEADRVTYHVSGRLERAPLPEAVSQADLPGLLNQFDARQILHVTFGPVLTARAADGLLRFYPRLMDILRSQPEQYAANLEKHFLRHLAPFVTRG